MYACIQQVVNTETLHRNNQILLTFEDKSDRGQTEYFQNKQYPNQ